MDVMERVRSTLGTYAENDVRSLLKADHDTLRDLTKELADAASAPARRSIVARLKPLLTAHSRAEEQSVYVPLTMVSGSPDSRMAGNEGAVEHSLADIVLGRLADTQDASTDIWKAHAKVLHELLNHHIDEEEKQVFEELGEHFSDEEREQMAVQFSAIKDAHLRSDPLPRARKS